MRFVSLRKTFLLFSVSCVSSLRHRIPSACWKGKSTTRPARSVSAAEVTASNPQTGFSAKQRSANDGAFHFASLPVGEYDLRVNADGFATFTASSIRIDIGRTVRIPVKLEVAAGHSEVSVTGTGATVDLGPTLGNVVSSHEATDLPLNGRNFTQLGLLQPGVAPMTGGLAEAGGLARANQAYAVNGQRPESNGYLLDGVSNVDNVNGGFAIRVPVDAIAEFRILTLNAPAEYGGTSGATTSVVTKSGGNEFTETSTNSCATATSTHATSSLRRSSRSTRTSSAPPSAARSAATKISSSPTTRACATARVSPRPPLCRRPLSVRAISRGWVGHCWASTSRPAGSIPFPETNFRRRSSTRLRKMLSSSIRWATSRRRSTPRR